MNIPDVISKNLVTKIWVRIFLEMVKFFVADLDLGSGAFLTLDLRSGMEKLVSRIDIPDPQHFQSRFK